MEFPERFNMADYFLYHNLEEGRENKVCLYFKDRTYTYDEVARMSNRAGNALRSVGVEMEDRVLMVLPDCPEFVWTWFGTIGQHHQDPIFHLDAHGTQSVSSAIAHSRDFVIGVSSIFEIEADFVLATFL